MTAERRETEPSSPNIAFITGGTGDTGSEIVRLLTKEGRRVIVGGKHLEKYDALVQSLPEAEAPLVAPFIVDLTDSEAVEAALDNLELEPGQTVDYYALAAGGFDKAQREFGRGFGGLRKALNAHNSLTTDDVVEAQRIFENANDQVFAEARKLNSTATVELARKLSGRGHLNSGSKIIYLGSTLSEQARQELETSPNEPNDAYKGPRFYRAVGQTKAEAAIKLRDLAIEVGASNFNLVAPLIRGTRIGNMIDSLGPVLFEVSRISGEYYELPTPTASEIAAHAVRETRNPLPSEERSVTIYIGFHPGEATRQQPSNFSFPVPNSL